VTEVPDVREVRKRARFTVKLATRRIIGSSRLRRRVPGPAGFTARDWLIVLARVRKEAKEDSLPLVAAGIAFWGILAVVPVLIGLIATCTLVLDPAEVRSQVVPATAGLPPRVAQLLIGQLSDATAISRRGLTLGLIASLCAILSACSRAISALISGLHVALDEEESRGFVKRRATGYALAIGSVIAVLLALALVAAFPLTLKQFGLEDVGNVLAFVIRWLLLAALALTGLVLLYRYAPDRANPDWQAVRWGAGIAMVLWLLVSGGLSLYIGHSDGYNQTYGTLAGMAALALWLYLSALIILLGAEIYAEIDQHLSRRAVLEDPEPAPTRDHALSEPD
jgi:membrane protein